MSRLNALLDPLLLGDLLFLFRLQFLYLALAFTSNRLDTAQYILGRFYYSFDGFTGHLLTFLHDLLYDSFSSVLRRIEPRMRSLLRLLC